MASSEHFHVAVKWQSRLIDVSLPLEPGAAPTVADLKHALALETAVSAKRMKLLGCKPAVFDDSMELSSLTIGKAGLTLLGTPDAVLAAEEVHAAVAPVLVDDLDLPDNVESVNIADDPAVLAKLALRVAAAKHVVLNQPRPGKKLLVLDIDYTIFDLNSSAERAEELARPHLHEMLAAVYPFYDVALWSATSMRWVQVKMKELGVLDHPDYRVMALLCSMSMVTVGPLPGLGVFDCKPLAYFWRIWPQHYGSHNTIMFDDLRRNFVMNPQCGLKIKKYRHAHVNRSTDDELVHLQRYLLLLADVADISAFNHDKWKQHLRSHGDAGRT